MSRKNLQQTWMDRILRAQKVRDEWALKFRVEMAREYFEGSQNPGEPAAEWITINKIYAHLMAQLPTLYAVDPFFYVRLKRSYRPDPMAIATWEARARVRSSMLNYLKEELDLKNTARLAIQDAHFEYGCVKVHYYSNLVENPEAGNPIIGENGRPLIGDDEDDDDLYIEPEYLPTDERYCVSHIDPCDLLWDEDAGPLPANWRWIAERTRMTRAEAMQDKRLSKSILRTTPAEDKIGKERPVLEMSSSGPPLAEEEMICLWEIYDLKAKQWLILAEGAEKPVMMPRATPPGVENHPYAILRFTLRSQSPYPIPPVSQALDPQKEYCLARSRILKHRKRFNRKYEVVQSLLEDETEVSKLESGDDGTCIMVMQAGAVRPISDAALDQMSYLEIQNLNADLIEAFGTPGEALGIASSDTATQAALMDRRLQIREGDRQSIVVDFLTEIGKKLDQLVQAHITRDEAVRIVGPEGEAWNLVRTDDYDDIQGEYEYGVVTGSTQPRLPQVERAQWLAMLQVLGQVPQFLLSWRLLKHLAELHQIDDEVMLRELQQIGQQMMSGQLPMPGQGGANTQGSVAGVNTQNPMAAILGLAGGQGGGLPGGTSNAAV